MKIRNDYVSNSSSSSFIVSLNTKLVDFKDFVKDTVKACTKKCDFEEKEYKKSVDECNRRNLDYCLNTYELLFLGSFNSGKEVVKYGKDSYDEIKTAYSKTNKHMVKSDNGVDEIEIEYDITANGNIVTHRFMDRLSYDEFDERVKDIINVVNNTSMIDLGLDSICMCEITKNTIRNTKDLIKAGYEVKLPKWCSNLESINKRFEDGERLFLLCIGYDGDIGNSSSLYAFNGWDTDFFNDVPIVFLSSDY